MMAPDNPHSKTRVPEHSSCAEMAFMKERPSNWCRQMLVITLTALLTACSTTKYVPDGKFLLDGATIITDDNTLNTGVLQQYVRQTGNSKWFSLVKIPLATYSLSGSDSTKWINRTLKKIGEEPVFYDSLQAKRTCNDLRVAMQNMGYLQSTASHDVVIRKKKARIFYLLHPGIHYTIGAMNYDIQDENIHMLLTEDPQSPIHIAAGTPFSVNLLEQERKDITTFLADRGFYRFHKEYIRYDVDTIQGNNQVAVSMHLLPAGYSSDSLPIPHKRYIVEKVEYVPSDLTRTHVRNSVLQSNTMIEPGMFYKASDVKRTYNNFSRLQAIKYANLRFTEIPDTNTLHCQIFYGTTKPSTIAFQPEGTNTAGDLGAAASITYENRNLFHGSENFSVKLRGAFEAITGLEGYQNDNYIEYGADSKLSFPSFLMPFLNKDYRRNINAVSELSLSYNLQNRPEFHRRVFSTAWRYRWDEPERNLHYRFDLLDLNYIYMPWISTTFKQEYLDNSTTRNAILRYNYEDLFIMKTGFVLTYSHKNHAIRANIETAGNVLDLASHLFEFKQNSSGQHTLFNIAFAQYAKGDFDYTKAFQFDAQNSLVFHAGLGIAYPYGNSRILPFEKRYFSGGANSVRGWGVRRLGPGKFKGNNGAIDFINQTGDMKLDLNLEYRTILFWKFYGALFIDAGNIWTLRDYEEQPGGQFKFNEFYKQIAVAYGLGLRLNFDYFILRFDMGMKAVDPVYENSREHFPVAHPNLDRDFCFHFAVGLPF